MWQKHLPDEWPSSGRRMTTTLDNILAFKRQEVAERKRHLDEDALVARLETMGDSPRGFFAALRERAAGGKAAMIAEILRAAPYSGVLREDFDAAAIARQLAANGATCLSVLTDKKFFMGNDIYLRQVRQATNLPVLRKDFIVDSYQVVESRVLGADAIWLIVAALSDDALREYTLLAHDLGMDVLAEVSDEAELERALQLPLRTIAANNRRAPDFAVDLDFSARVQARLPGDYLLVSEHGLRSHDDIRALQEKGVQAFLAGGVLMQENDPGAALGKLMGGDKHGE
ncbi:MAG: indole-3-glycerol phosphate synthase TrpC [Cardiobacteriaceae bacterium]|nr:indole-3-glycerol phosphate synthase TrpC [Cardiobacteriaceae bacterium]